MSKKRIQKKRALQAERDLVEATGKVTPLYAIRHATVTVPCPACAHATMERRYIPAIGGMNGSVCCPRCKLEAPYVDVLTRAMGDELPPEPVTPSRPLPIPAPVLPEVQPSARTVFLETVAMLAIVLRGFFGIRRRWRFAEL